jgi:coenzyme F420-0:L-glutamate ligase/coenzyme F420-1:gamma-L-glutamate ligase
LVKSGDDVADIIVRISEKDGLRFQDGDVIVVAQKVFSKAEKRVFRLREVIPSERAEKLSKITGKDPRFVELVLRESKKVLKASREILLVEDRRGLVCINAGIDKSNVSGAGNYALLPEDPDESAKRCRLQIERLTGRNVSVIICDTYSRPFRRGQVNFAIGDSGVSLFRDYRGTKDLFDQVLKVKNVAVADEIAAAAELLMGQGREATPVAIIRGLGNSVEPCEECKVSALKISNKDDLFRGAL